LKVSRAESSGVSFAYHSPESTINAGRLHLRLIEALQVQHNDVEVLWDRSSEKPVKILGHLTSKNVKVDITSKRNWFGVSGNCDFGTQSMPLEQLLQSLPLGSDQDDVQGEYVRIADGQWARVSQDLRNRLQRLRDATHADRKALMLDATAAPAVRDLMDSEIEVSASENWHECLARLSRAEKLEPMLPAGLDAELRDYQVDGYKWLRRLAEWGVGGVLADDMGLGKTLQTLAVLLDRAADGPALVIAPTSVGFNWVREAQRFTPSLHAHLYRETERGGFLTSVGPNDLVVCSYGLALRDQTALGKIKWATVVMDEAQAVKNSRSKTAQAIAKFNAQWIVALTGTPVENHLGELWSLFHLVSPGVFGGWDQFRRRYALPIEKHSDADARATLAERIQPFVLRRTKSQVLKELPPRTEMNLYVDLAPEERQQYERVRLSAIGEIDQIAAIGDVQDQRFKLLALLTRLRQFACHPGIVNKQWTGSSAKLDQLCSTLEELKEEGHRALIFSQFTQHLDLIRKALDERGITYQYLDGSTPATARQQRVDAFQAGEGDAFLISLKAGGTGLNLTGADYVIHMDPWWNPAVEDQATDRAHRIGQDKPVMVYRIIARGTIEEEILSLHETKRDLVTGVLEGTAAAATLSTSELMSMLRAQP
jgi:SNF2 family DNA or RNA helicase